jgi:hypothetical protein
MEGYWDLCIMEEELSPYWEPSVLEQLNVTDT